ncbi:MAG TPA: adenylate/guanylate cyclase domain-containing protein [Nocardioidaceae bacterium]|nr:adenylate/guanylate cyclase domain-containing protein [Nocardioidaceae bacterium]
MTLQQAVARRLEWLPVDWRVRVALTAGLAITNFVALALVFLLLALRLVPVPLVEDPGNLQFQNFMLAVVYVVVVGLTGIALAIRDIEPLVKLLRSKDQATDDERARVLDAPLLLFIRQALLWALGAVVFGVFNATHDAELGLSVGLVVGLAGLSVASVTYLTTERAFRPLAGMVLESGGLPERLGVRRVSTRLIFAWALGTGIILFGIVVIGLSALLEPEDTSPRRLAITMIVLGVSAVVIGGFTNLLAAGASSDPIRALREGVAAVREGDLDAHVRIYDGTEIGVLQAGFNDMVAGLREREQIRELFGRHVGDDVARRALDGGVHLGGEVRDVAVLFVDIVGSTSIAEDRPPHEVVGLLNRFFDVVIEVVHQYDGWINKFQGDAALAIWGAPAAIDDRDTLVLAAARVMARRLRDEVPELSAGIGVSAGRAVAGNVGAAERYEYTVIGDPVNEAARLTDIAKTVPGHCVANAKLLLTAGGNEVHWWTQLEPVVVRGRSEPTEIATPRLGGD